MFRLIINPSILWWVMCPIWKSMAQKCYKPSVFALWLNYPGTQEFGSSITFWLHHSNDWGFQLKVGWSVEPFSYLESTSADKGLSEVTHCLKKQSRTYINRPVKAAHNKVTNTVYNTNQLTWLKFSIIFFSVTSKCQSTVPEGAQPASPDHRVLQL